MFGSANDIALAAGDEGQQEVAVGVLRAHDEDGGQVVPGSPVAALAQERPGQAYPHRQRRCGRQLTERGHARQQLMGRLAAAQVFQTTDVCQKLIEQPKWFAHVRCLHAAENGEVFRKGDYSQRRQRHKTRIVAPPTSEKSPALAPVPQTGRARQLGAPPARFALAERPRSRYSHGMQRRTDHMHSTILPTPRRPRALARLIAGALTLAVLAAVLLGAAPAQVPDKAKGLKTNQATKRNNGSAGVLTGAVCLFNLFVDDKESHWTRAERDQVRGRLMAATTFLDLHARKYNKKVSFTVAYQDGLKYEAGLPTDMFVDPSWTEAVLRLTGAVSGNALVKRLKQQHGAEHVLLLIHVNKNATSYSLSYYDNIDQTYSAERVVCFNRYADGRPSAAATYAHEILHGFGAGELYFPFDENGQRKQLGKKWFPNDVMQRVDYNIDVLNVGAYTAYRVGWLNRLADEYKMFED